MSLARKILGTVGILLFSVLYAALVIWLLIRFDGLQVEWRGGYIPVVTYHKTLTDFESLEADRARQRMSPATSTATARTNSSYWTGFRGPHRDGCYDEQPILTNWPAVGLRRLWRQPCGGGYASFAIAEGLAFTIEQRRDDEVAVAYDVETSREIWTNRWKAFFSEPMGGDGPRATPCWDRDRLYVLGATGQLRCLDARTGKKIWARDILADARAGEPTYGVAASPLIVGERVIVLTGAGGGRSVLCYDKNDGQIRWHAVDDVTGYASPMLATLAGQERVIVCTETRTVGMALEDGRVIWEYPWRVLNNQLPIAQPVILSSNRFLLSAGYFTGCAAAEVSPAQSGFSARTLWKNKNLKNKFTSSIFWQGYIYGLDEDILTCLDAATGERKWKDGRYGYGQLLLASGCLVILTSDGDLALVRATPVKHEALARFPAIRGKTWNHPAIAGGRLLVRNAVEMACFDISP